MTSEGLHRLTAVVLKLLVYVFLFVVVERNKKIKKGHNGILVGK